MHQAAAPTLIATASFLPLSLLPLLPMDLAQTIQAITLYAIPVLFAITVHEAAHGYAARYLGDNTAWNLGRVTLNPLRHIDPIGTIAMPLALYLLTGGALLFGYAKPVPINFGKLRNPKRDMVWVALAGPGSNLAQAILWGAALYLCAGLGLHEPFVLQMCKGGILVNVVMFVFNLFPMPPLDGGRIVVGLLPPRLAWQYSKIEPYGFFIVMALVVTGIASRLWMYPLMNLTYAVVDLILSPLSILVR